jgi:hypothetical protein
MRTRVWRQLPSAVERPHTAAQDAVVRIALGMFVADRRAALTPAQRARVLARLEDTTLQDQPFTAQEKAQLKGPLLAYIKEYHNRIYDIVQAQFSEKDS